MGIILAVCGIGFYQLIAQEQWQSLNRKLATIAGTLHDGIEPALSEPGKVEPIMDHFLPGLVCINHTPCPEPVAIAERHIAGVVHQQDYYIRFIDPAGNLLATAGRQPVGLPTPIASVSHQTLKAADGNSYRQISVFLKTQTQIPWGYIQVGQSLAAYETYLAGIRWTLMLGLPVAMLLVAGASWWLSGIAMRPVYQSYQQIQQFTADAAHELRTPLAAIRSTVEFTLDEPELSDTEVRSTLRLIERQNHRLSNLVQDLLLLSRIGLHTHPLNLRACSLNTLVEDLVEEFSALAIAADLVLKSNLQTAQSLTVLGDEEQLYRLFANLVTNAIQYTPAGGTVTLHLHQEEGTAVLAVQDTGSGIPLSDQSRIFDRFYRVNQDRARHTGGSGLGLAIAQAIAQSHQAIIQVQSALGQGSTFTVRLPLKPSRIV
ncbi:two-component sensor histidine kinase [Leptothermofonsia sichuanensis E412]|nr:two-component system sensor histidine kinase RppB [Leptothermofonsia sichuanensis]QZZ23717.1 two-component sensor histidine kinase [Leptothermofonsia sichuanensis E412]